MSAEGARRPGRRRGEVVTARAGGAGLRANRSHSHGRIF